MNETAIDWLMLGISLLLVLGYEIRGQRAGIRAPGSRARTAHARLRADWARAVLERPGNEVLAIQAMRNGLMSSTVIASSAALGLMGALTLVRPTLTSQGLPALRWLLAIALLCDLFAILLFAIMAVRFYNHAGYLVGRPGAGGDAPVVELAQAYVVRAGNHYSLSLRGLLWLLPIVAGLVRPLLLVPAAIALIVALRWFDRAPPVRRAERL